jgi:hypothetical protein
MTQTDNLQTPAAEKILRRVKHLRDHLLPGEIPLLAIPAIWDSGKQRRSIPCEVIVTNQRLLGYYVVDFPRKRLFLEELSLSTITAVTLRHKSYEPLFRELMVSNAQRKIYIRTSRRHIEVLFSSLRTATEQYIPETPTTFEEMLPERETSAPIPRASLYGRQDIHTPFSQSLLAIVLLLVGGMALEVTSFGLWMATQSVQIALPLFLAGLVAVLAAIFLRRQK